MPAHTVEHGHKYRITIEGYVVYSAGGYVRLSDKPQTDLEDHEDTHYLEVPEYMIVGEPEHLPLYEDGTLFEDENGGIWKAHRDSLRLITGSQDMSMAQYPDPTNPNSLSRLMKLTRLYRDGEI